MKLSTLYMQMVILYFKLVDKIELGLTRSSFEKFQNLFSTKVSTLLSKINNSQKNNTDQCSVQIVFYDALGNGQDLGKFMKRHSIQSDWSVTKFLDQTGGIFSAKLKIERISSIIKPETHCKLFFYFILLSINQLSFLKYKLLLNKYVIIFIEIRTHNFNLK